MKFNCRSSNCEQRSMETGSAVLVVVILLGIMTTLAVANSRTLYYLHRDLNLIEQKQQRKFGDNVPAPPASATNQTEKGKSKG